MDATGLTFCYSSPYGANSLVYQLKTTDDDLRYLFNLDEPCGIITFLMCLFTTLVIACAMISMNTVIKNEKIIHDLQDDADKKLPRKDSVLDLRPAYNCIHKHLMQTDVFQEKAKRTLWKERLDIEIMNSRISCINKLLRPEAPQSKWRKSRSPKLFSRNANPNQFTK